MEEERVDLSQIAIAARVVISSFPAKINDQECKLYRIRSFSQPLTAEAYLISETWLSEESLKKMKETIELIEKESLEQFS